ncbi:helix-turn-helix domain-containing protein [Planctomicrobium sp. SH661]|uniref:helix-turn-helix domain-containing protein n=1 Tax=Planctomicrobium sp. SH661 TaxID=3448124 RepID=UPI003F5BA21D
MSARLADLYHEYLELTRCPSAAATMVLAAVTRGEPTVEMLTTKQAAKRLGVCSETVRTLCRSGTLQSVKVGNTRRIQSNHLDEYLRQSS